MGLLHHAMANKSMCRRLLVWARRDDVGWLTAIILGNGIILCAHRGQKVCRVASEGQFVCCWWDESLVECRMSEVVAFGLSISREMEVLSWMDVDGDNSGSSGCRQTGRGKSRRQMECFDFLECYSSRPERSRISLNSCQISVQHGTLGLGDCVKFDRLVL